jgi:hypothetical protein
MNRNVQNHLDRELDILRKYNEKPVILEFEKPIREIVDIFSKQGHSGFSATYYSKILTNALTNILDFKALSPLTGEDDEWSDISREMSREKLFQNVRNTAVFKEDGKSHYIYAIIWENIDNKHDTFTGKVEGIKSSVNIGRFPFVPKSFNIYVKKVNGECPISGRSIDDQYHYEIVDKTQLEKVYEYYKNEEK